MVLDFGKGGGGLDDILDKVRPMCKNFSSALQWGRPWQASLLHLLFYLKGGMGQYSCYKNQRYLLPDRNEKQTARVETLTVILVQIVMVSPGTHLLKNHESLSITSDSQFKKKQAVLNWKCLGLYVTRQLIWRQMPKLFITNVKKN